MKVVIINSSDIVHIVKIYLQKVNQKHTQICAAKEGIVYSFNNCNIISFQDNFKYLGDLPFTVYFDFERTTGDAVYFDPKMYFSATLRYTHFNLS